MDVGVRELKSKLSEYLHRAAAGEDIVVSDRGRPVARLTAYSSNSAFERGIEEGWIEPPRRTQLGPAERHRSTASVLDVLDEDRG
ncbi:MAG: type II toxin-antitoxin system prevent-host-death family antitoxin [Actinobacteria bacterium]|jgi:prevent-host-death family protein|nr:type II toxin-antitoxin system prevent-host-death family antitoxin [Actinomycetota bacterium]